MSFAILCMRESAYACKQQQQQQQQPLTEVEAKRVTARAGGKLATGNWLRFDDKPPPSSAIRNENLPKKYTREQDGNFKSLLGLHTVTELHKSPAKELENTRKHIDMGIENAK